LKSVLFPTFGEPMIATVGRTGNARTPDGWRGDTLARASRAPQGASNLTADYKRLTGRDSLDRVDVGPYTPASSARKEIRDMIKADIINKVSEVAEITKVKAVEAVEAVFEAMKTAMQRGERIELRGFGVFQVKPRKRGIGRNPRTGREVRIPPGKTIRFKPGKNLRNLT
jgi:DNA-binding protein HU-beta